MRDARSLCGLNAAGPHSPSNLNAQGAYLSFRRDDPRQAMKAPPMQDLIWLAVLAGLFLATLAYVRLCDEA